MLLDKMVSIIPQQEYVGKVTLEKLKKMPLEDIHDRFAFVAEVLKYHNSLGMFPVSDGVTLYDFKKVKQKLYECISFSSNTVIVGGILKQICKDLSFEFIQANNASFDFDIFKLVVKGQRKIAAFIVNDTTANTSGLWSFSGASGQNYFGKGKIEFTKLTGDQMRDIMIGLNLDMTKDKLLVEVRDFLLNKENGDVIKRLMNNARAAYLSFLIPFISEGEVSRIVLLYEDYILTVNKRKKAQEEKERKKKEAEALELGKERLDNKGDSIDKIVSDEINQDDETEIQDINGDDEQINSDLNTEGTDIEDESEGEKGLVDIEEETVIDNKLDVPL